MENIERPEPYSQEEVLGLAREWIEDGNDDFRITEDDEVVYKEHPEMNIVLNGNLIADLEGFHGFTPKEAIGEILTSARGMFD